MIDFENNLSEINRRLIKFTLYCVLIYYILVNIPCNKISQKETILIMLSSCCIFILIDIHIPSIIIYNNKK